MFYSTTGSQVRLRDGDLALREKTGASYPLAAAWASSNRLAIEAATLLSRGASGSAGFNQCFTAQATSRLGEAAVDANFRAPGCVWALPRLPFQTLSGAHGLCLLTFLASCLSYVCFFKKKIIMKSASLCGCARKRSVRQRGGGGSAAAISRNERRRPRPPQPRRCCARAASKAIGGNF
jgi:hypothetical protein